MKKVLIDLDVITTAIWDRNKESLEFLSYAEQGKYTISTPLFLLFHILRNWKYKKLADRIFKEFDKITDIFLQESKINKELEQKTGLTLRLLIRKASKELDINPQDATIVLYASLSLVDEIITYNRKHMKNKEKEIGEFLKKYNLHVPKIALPNGKTEDSSSRSFQLSQSFIKFLPSTLLQFFGNFFSSYSLFIIHVNQLVFSTNKHIKLFLPVTLFFIIMFSSTALAQENGKIYQLSYLPAEPVVFGVTTISIGVENSGDKTQNYLMHLQIVKEGKVMHEQEFTFALEKTKGIFFTPQYTPQDIGDHEVIVRLYDKFQIDLLDTQIIKFNVVSHLGPFDISIDTLTTRIRPGIFLPAILLLENKGAKGTDVEVRVSVNCPDKILTQTLTFFIPANNQTERLVTTQTCDQEGLYDILASIIIFNKTWVSSSSQFFVNASYIQLQFDAPEKITLKPGESYSFPVEVTNLGNQKISDLQFIIQRIPLAWQKISPSSIIEVEPNEKVVFIVSITVPQDAETRSYEVRMTAAAEEVLERKISTLEIASLAALPVVPSAGTPIVTYTLIFISSLISLAIGGGLLRKYIKRLQRAPIQKERLEILKKIKEKITPK